MKTAILIDGGFYRKRAKFLFGKKTPQDRADEIFEYALAHLKKKRYHEDIELYRIFYYDCPPISGTIYNPLTQTNATLDETETAKWTLELFKALSSKRKLALRLGSLSRPEGYSLRPASLKKLIRGDLTVADLTDRDIALNVVQKGVDMKIGLDILHLAYRRLVDQIILISGDSDFVPAAKLARREGVDFILDSMGQNVSEDLFLHIDGFKSHYKQFTPVAENENLVP